LRLGLGGAQVPLILQTEAAECGLACLAMVAGAHGLHTDLATLRQRFSLSLKGATLADLVRMAESLQLHSRALRAEMDEIRQLQLPCVLHWDMNHFVVLVAIKGDELLIHDPARGARRIKLEDASRHFTGVVLELTPAGGFAPADEKRHVTVRQLLGPVTRPEAVHGPDPAAGLGAGGLCAVQPLPDAVGGGQRAGQRRPRPAHHAGHRLRAAGAGSGGHRRSALLGGAGAVGDAQPAVGGQRLRPSAAPAGGLVREATCRATSGRALARCSTSSAP
jgi:hypothetical protein